MESQAVCPDGLNCFYLFIVEDKFNSRLSATKSSTELFNAMEYDGEMIDPDYISELRKVCTETLKTLNLCVRNSSSKMVTQKLQAGINQCQNLLRELDNTAFTEVELQSWTNRMTALTQDLVRYANLIMHSDESNN